ncbi:hypothetical protein BT69DRAFT_175083 [Atractiella rhizophila]|nr:hypothetical protein BT69DRAFT_175083 [Atractiella rhizophila]
MSTTTTEKKRTRTRKVINPLQRGLACETCRKRKVRCCASKPACTSCRRTAIVRGRDPSKVICVYPDPVLSSPAASFIVKTMSNPPHQPPLFPADIETMAIAEQRSHGYLADRRSSTDSYASSSDGLSSFDAATSQLLASFQSYGLGGPIDVMASIRQQQLQQIEQKQMLPHQPWAETSSAAQDHLRLRQQALYNVSHMPATYDHFQQSFLYPTPARTPSLVTQS